MMNDNTKKQHPPAKRHLTMIVFLVIFVFLALLSSIAIAGGVLYIFNHFGFVQPIPARTLPMIWIFLLCVSLLVAVTLTIIFGNISLRPVKSLVTATREVAAGNFDVRIRETGLTELDRLAVSFNEMASELSSIETLRNDFVSSISHEFKTPVASIRGFAKMLKKDDLTKEQQDEYLDIIISESDRLSQLTHNVLLLSDLNNTQKLVDITDFSLDEQLRQTILILNEELDKKNLELDIALEPCNIVSNQEMLQQVWINLLSNAIKFTPDGGRISVALTVDADYARIAVSDTGIGIAPAARRHIFDKFYQVEASHSSDGNGLGLALVKQIVTLCEGSIEVESEEGAGSTFTVALPRRPE